jgi:hypothetical protein
VQTGWPSVTIEQHGDACVARAQFEHDSNLVGQAWALNGSKSAHLEANADCNSFDFEIHGFAPQIWKTIAMN